MPSQAPEPSCARGRLCRRTRIIEPGLTACGTAVIRGAAASVGLFGTTKTATPIKITSVAIQSRHRRLPIGGTDGRS